MQTRYQSSTGMMQTRRFRPYETPRARSNEHANMEAGLSNIAPPPVQYVAPLPTSLSGETTEATANAETIQPITDENAAPVSNFYCSHIPHATE